MVAKIKHDDFFKKGQIGNWILSLKKILQNREVTQKDVKQIIK